MNTKFYSGGFLLVAPAQRSEYMDDSIIPNRIINPSDCICDIHPQPEALSWTSTSQDNRKAWRENLGITKSQESEIHKNTDQWFNDKKLGWESIFYELSNAIEYRDNFIGSITEIVILEVGTNDFYASEFIDEFKPQKENEGEIGLVHALRRKQSMLEGFPSLGFDTFGFEYGGSFHSFTCNSLEKDYKSKLGLSFTEHGFLVDFGSAIKAAEYNNDPETGCEPVLWQPWIINQINCQPEH